LPQGDTASSLGLQNPASVRSLPAIVGALL
jgi:hypothetical protein